VGIAPMAKRQQDAEPNVSSVENCEILELRKKDLKHLLLSGQKFDDFDIEDIERDLDHGREIDLSDFEEQ